MGALTNARDTTEIMNGGKQLVLSVALGHHMPF